MKISKLFHWLYACLMLMPIFAIGGKCLYVVFNKNAKDSYYGQTINEEIDTYYNGNELVNNETYYINYYGNNLITLSGFDTYSYYLEIEETNFELSFNLEDIVRIRFSYSAEQHNIASVYFLRADSEQEVKPFLSDKYVKFRFLSKSEPSSAFPDNNFSVICDMFKKVSYNKYSFLDNVFYYAVDDINNQPIFAWANDSFLSEPITYIGSLFGIQSGSAIYTMLSYWLSISIIWLTFDLLMYIPLLAHRWIDKGILE